MGLLQFCYIEHKEHSIKNNLEKDPIVSYTCAIKSKHARNSAQELCIRS
jgi:hypothetical protein